MDFGGFFVKIKEKPPKSRHYEKDIWTVIIEEIWNREKIEKRASGQNLSNDTTVS